MVSSGNQPLRILCLRCYTRKEVPPSQMFKRNPLHLLYLLLIILLTVLIFYLLIKLFPLYKPFFSVLWRLLSPFLIACFIAYLLYPVIMHLHEQWKLPRGIAIIAIYVLFFIGIGYLIYRVYPVALMQIRDLNEYLPQAITMYEQLIYQLYESTSFLPESVHDKIDDVILTIETYLDHLLGKIIDGFTKLFDLIILLTVIPVLVFYFLKDYENMKQFFKGFIPDHYEERLSDIIRSIDKRLGHYIRGQLIVCFIVGLVTFIVFYILNIKYALLLAIIVGLTNIIPYFGPIIGAIPAVLITLTDSLKLVVFVLITIFVVQLLESNLLQPYIVGKSINIHPIAIIFALLLGAQISGVWGMILAVPTLAIVKEVIYHTYPFLKSNQTPKA